MKIDKITGRRRLRPPRADLQRHARKCHICHHPQRAEIEDDFLNWRGPNQIVKDYRLPHWSVIYRHANALGLRARRNENVAPSSTSSSNRRRPRPLPPMPSYAPSAPIPASTTMAPGSNSPRK